MNKHLQLSLQFELKNHLDQRVILITIGQDSLPKLCLGLTLLREGLVQSLEVNEQTRKAALKLSVGRQPKTGRVAHASLSSKLSQVELTHNGLAYLQHFFLKYYRDGVADVDHIDLQLVSEDTGRNDAYITFRVPDFKPPFSLEQARGRLQS